jgi:hypothetical protein
VVVESPSKLSRIESRAFGFCSSLTLICIPKAVKWSPFDACFGCRSLQEIRFDPPE